VSEFQGIIAASGSVPDRDRETARLLMQGDPDGLRRLLADHGGRVSGLLRKEFATVLDLQEIDDAVSQASVRAWRASDRYDPQRGTLGAWLYVIARNCARRMIESKKRRVELSFVDDLDSNVAVRVEHAEEQEEAPKDKFLQDVLACIQDLPPQQRAVLLADFAAGGAAQTAALAEQLKTSHNSIYVSRNNGRKALRAAMLQRGHTFDYKNVPRMEGFS
jgi:RNA polymerase sigma factor (sigma-70 family)